MDATTRLFSVGKQNIVCILCKSKRTGEERMYMFGGNRPIMAKFENQLINMISAQEFRRVCNQFRTSSGRCYICTSCYRLVHKTHRQIVKVQKGISNTLKRVAGVIQEQDNSDHDPELHTKFAPARKRHAKRTSAVNCVMINNTLPYVRLSPLAKCFNQKQGAVENVSERNTLKDSEYQNLTHSEQRSLPCSSRSYVTGSLRTCLYQEKDIKGQSVLSTSNVTYKTDGTKETEASGKSLSIIKNGIQQTETANSCAFHKSREKSRKDVEDLCVDVSVGIQRRMLRDKGISCADGRKPHLLRQSLLVKQNQPIKLMDIRENNILICGKDGCDWIFPSPFLLENHIRHFHFSGKPFQCYHKDCGRYFVSKSRLELHVRSHTGEKPFVCEQCGKAFMGRQELRHHLWTHTDTKPFQCSWPGCSQTYKYKSTLKRHLRHHDSGRMFTCPYPGCVRVFASSYELKCHVRRHTGERPVKCPVPGCDKAFRLPCQLTSHRRLVHTGECPFQCTVQECSAKFVTRGALTSHLMTHSGQARYCCHLCGKTFKYKMSYTLHSRKHIRESAPGQCSS